MCALLLMARCTVCGFYLLKSYEVEFLEIFVRQILKRMWKSELRSLKCLVVKRKSFNLVLCSKCVIIVCCVPALKLRKVEN